ncbi:MAG: hypothetical protein QOJ79_897 [Actinomycetota bacterium]|nr:hypothetical protein [Actinomycetota bacterium]
MRLRRLPLILSALALAGAAAAAFPAGAATSTPAGPVFGHEVIIDHQRSGFEPDIVVSSKNVLYSSVPNGSSQAHSFIWNSLDSGDSFQLIPGQFGVGKPLTCPQGGGDTELQRDEGDNLYLSDLQNLSNLSNAVSTDGGKTFNFSCTSAPNTPVDRMWYASHGKLGDPDFAIYEEYDAVLSNTSPNSPIGNQLVEIVSHDGANFTPVVNANPGPDCLGGGVVNCVTNEEGLPGNQILTKKGDLVIAHSGQNGNSVYVSVGHPTTTGSGQAAVTTATWKDVLVNGDICPLKNGNTSGICGSTNFPTIQQDSAGNLYLVNSAQEPKAPYGVYVNVSKDGGSTWGPSVLVSKDGSNAFPWLTAGSEGRVAVAWYHANEEGESGKYAFDDLAHAEFSVQVAQSIDALAANPHYDVVTASEHPIKYGPICTAGTTCTVSMGDRSLGDYLNLGVDQDGGLALVYVDDTSNSFTTGPTGAVAENGPPVYQKQIGGPTMIAGKTPHGSLPVNTISDRSGDSLYSANSTRTPAGDNVDLTAASVSEDAGGLVITMKVKSLESLQINPTAGGTTGTWITRFTTYNPATPGNGHIYYAGMESVAGQAPRFFDGDVGAPSPAGVQISMAFDSARAIKGDYKPNGTITLHVPFADIPGAKRGQPIYSATAFTGSTLASLSGNPEGVINVLDQTAPFNHVVGNAAAPVTPVTPPKGGGAPPPASGGGSGAPSGGNLAATGLGLQLPLVGLGLIALAVALRRRRA